MSYETHICNFSLGILTYMFASQFLHLLAMLRAAMVELESMEAVSHQAQRWVLAS